MTSSIKSWSANVGKTMESNISENAKMLPTKKMYLQFQLISVHHRIDYTVNEILKSSVYRLKVNIVFIFSCLDAIMFLLLRTHQCLRLRVHKFVLT